MSKQTKALKLALEALNELIPDVHDWYGAKVHRANAAITAIREALAEQTAQRKPPTQDMVKSCPYYSETLRGAFFDGWIKAEAAHGIKGDA